MKTDKVFNKSFNALLVTQFFGACNDNVLRLMIALQVVDGIWKGRLGEGGQGIVTLLFSLPFLLFSGWAGQIADRLSKQRLTVWVKTAEIVLALVSLIGLWTQNLYICLLALLMLAMQSTVFGPAKYGLIPEIFEESALGRANGAINMLTNVAIILGVQIGGFLSGAYPEERLLPGMVMLGIAVAGYISSRFILPVQPHDPTIRLSNNPFSPYIYAITLMFRRRQMIVVALGWSFFSLIGVIVLQAVLDFKLLLDITDKTTALLNIPIMVGVGIGSALAGWLSKERIRISLVPLGAVGLTVFLAILGTLHLTVFRSWVLLTICGVFGGFYVVPLQALIQALAPAKLRGRIIGTTNFLSFVFIALGGFLYWFLKSILGLDVQQVLVFNGVVTIVVAGYLIWRIRSLFSEESEVLEKEE